MIPKRGSQKTRNKQIRSFASFQMFHTHASLPRGWFFGNCGIGGEALIWALKQDMAVNAKSKYREETCS